jgi:uncharacterized protein (TIGR03437 family)
MRSDVLRALRCGLVIGAAAFALEGQHSTTPVLLVNGFQLTCPDSGTFGQLAPILMQDGASSVELFDVCTLPGAPIEQLAGLLAAKIQSYSGPVDVVAHSMGGLVVRAYLQGWTTSPNLNPPANPNIRKLVMLGTPNAGVSNVFSFLWPSEQVNEMQFGSLFLWSLGTWNQLHDDLRGISTLAVAGTAGIFADGVPWDGVVDVASASLDFADSSGIYTRAVPYCHTSDDAVLCAAGAPSIANVPNRSHLSYQLIRSFLDGTNEFVGIAPQSSQDSSTGGMRLTLSGANGGFYASNQLSAVSLANNGVVYSLANPVPGSPVWTYNAIPAGQNYTVTMNLAGQLFTVSGVSIPAGGFVSLPIKFPPTISEILPSPGIPQGELSVAAGSLISLYGAGLAKATAQASTSPAPYQLADVTLTIGGLPVPLLYASAQQINAIVPSNLEPGLYTLVLTNSLGQSSINLLIETTVPALFTSTNNAVSAEDAITGRLITSANPGTAGEFVSLFGTGLGPTFLSNGVDYSVNTPSVYIGGMTAKVTFAGRTPGFSGLDQINVQIPAGLPTGNSSVVLTNGNRASNGVLLAIK